MMAIIDGDERMPAQIAADQGFTGIDVTSDEVKEAVAEVISDPSNAAIIEKILGGNDRPIMSLVGKVMKAVNRNGDPVMIKSLIQDSLDGKMPKKT